MDYQGIAVRKPRVGTFGQQMSIFDFLDGEPLTDYEFDKTINPDHVATPRYVVEDIYRLIEVEQFRSIWFPFDNYDSQFKLKADELKLTYKATHIFDNLRNDFFKTNPPAGCDLMISNPPFSIQNAIIQRSFELHDTGKIKSFCLLLPLSTLETPARSSMFESHESEMAIIIFRKRIKFIGKKTSFNTACCWICVNVPTIHQKILWI